MAVKCILTGQDKIFVEGLLKGDGTGNVTAADETEVELVDLPQEVFWATYGETTNAELEEAYNANKLILCKYNTKIYRFTNMGVSDGIWQAYCVHSTYQGYLTLSLLQVSNGKWLESTKTIVDTGRKSISLPAASWIGSDPYTQEVTISVTTSASMISIQPSEEVYDQLVADNVGYLAIKNVNGTLTAVAKGGKPSVNLTVQVTYNNVN